MIMVKIMMIMVIIQGKKVNVNFALEEAMKIPDGE
jgi:hypothetical protein